jgi:predicted ribosomally synthesized peptide with SipW-like signal peptide
VRRVLGDVRQADNDFASLREDELISVGGALLLASQATMAFLTDRLRVD